MRKHIAGAMRTREVKKATALNMTKDAESMEIAKTWHVRKLTN